MSQIIDGAFINGCCAESRIFDVDSSSAVLHIDISNWTNEFNRDALMAEIDRFRGGVALSLKSIPPISTDICNWLTDNVGPHLVEVNVESCNLLSWKELKKIISKSTAVRTLRFSCLSWVDDLMVEQLTFKCNKTVVSLELENVKVSDVGLFQISKMCPNLKRLSIICCRAITDAGLIEISKRMQLGSITLRHNMMITDNGFEAVLRKSSNLHLIDLCNCPKITTFALASLYENKVAWGKKRNERAAHITSLSLRGNPNIGPELLSLLSLSSPKLQTLDLRDCDELNLHEGLKHLVNMENLTNLKIGPTRHPFHADKFIETLSPHLEAMKCLHLCSLRSLTSDAHVAEIISYTVELEELFISNVPFGTLTVEAICSNVPNVSRLSLIGSQVIDDRDLRCLVVVCRNLKEFTLNNCKNITDTGYARCAHLRLNLLDLSNAPEPMNGSALACFSCSPLGKLVLDNSAITLQSPQLGSVLLRMTPITKRALLHLSIQNNPLLTPKDVYTLLDHFVFCRVMNFTGCQQLLPGIEGMWHPHPCLDYVKTKSFLGYQASEVNRAAVDRLRDILAQTRKGAAARTVQATFRDWQKRLKQKAADDDALFQLQKQYWAKKIQSVCRMMLALVRFRPRLAAGRMIVRAGRRYCNTLMFRKMQFARTYRNERLVSASFRAICKFSADSKAYLQNRVENFVLPRFHKRLIRRYFNNFMNSQGIQKDLKFCECAAAVWEENILVKLMAAWKSLKGETRANNQKLVRQFMLCVTLKSHNSIRQEVQKTMADHFRWMSLVLPGWIAFRDDQIRAIKAERMMPMAAAYFLKMFMNRVSLRCFKSLAWYRSERHFKKAAVARGELQLDHWSIKFTGRKLLRNAENRKRSKANMINLLEFLKERPRAIAVKNYQRNARMKKRARITNKKAVDFNLKNVWKRWKKGIINRKSYNMLNALAEYTFAKKKKNFVVAGWKRITENAKNIDEFMWGKYCDRLKRKALRGFRMNLDEAVEFKNQLASDLARMAGEKIEEEVPIDEEAEAAAAAEAMKALRDDDTLTPEEKAAKKAEAEAQAAAVAAERARVAEEKARIAEERLKILFGRVILLQALARGFTQRMKFRKFKVAAEWASQVLQNFGRRAIAMMRFNLRIKRWIMAERKRQEKELDLMREEEVQKRYFDIHWKAAVDIQRCFRGYKGREVVSAIAVVWAREKGQKFFRNMQEIRKAYERELRAAAVKELNRIRSATQIQALVRGVIARKLVAQLRVLREIDRHTITIQRYYRGRLARLQLNSLRRDCVHMDRYKAARRQRGHVLRLFGYRKRHKQLALSQYLDALGFEPTSFNYRVWELFRDTKADFFDLMEILRREKSIYQETKGNKVLVINARRKYFANKGVALKRDDAVLVIEPNHKFYGYTGVVVRVDISVPGQPLYEVKLDGLPRQTFVHMTTDGLSYYMEYPQPLTRITKKPDVTAYFKNRREVIYMGSEEPDFSKDRIEAAWKIQCAYRMFAARKRVSRRRYETWMRQADTQRSLINLLQSTNTLTTQAYFAAGKLRLRPLNNIKFDELRHTIESARLMALRNSGNITSAIQFEGLEKFKKRMKFLEKAALNPEKNPFLLGWQKITTAKKIMMFFRVSAGMISRSALRLKDMCGSRGVRTFSKKAGLVTGLSTHTFNHFYGSPHVRFPNVQMYQGEWKGLPGVSRLVPHGDGVVMFFDGWGFSREDKVLHVTVIAARHLNAADINTSDPFCEIICNGKNLQTSVIWGDLNPVWNEHFEIDVTNPNAGLNIVVKDKDYIGDDDFLGQILIGMRDLADGEWHREVYQLRGEDVTVDETFDRGEIELKLRWTDRTYDDDISGIQARKAAAIRVQAWARRLAAKALAKKYREDLANKNMFIRKVSIMITNTCRIRLARKEFKRRLRRYRAAVKIQKRARIRIARNITKSLKIRRDFAIRIQTIARMYNAKQLLKRLRIERRNLLNRCATAIQRLARKMLAIMYVAQVKLEHRAALIAEIRAKRKAEQEELEGGEGDDVSVGNASAAGGSVHTEGEDSTTFVDESTILTSKSGKSRKLSFELPKQPPVVEWIGTYGIDPDYYLRRNRRITERAFHQLLKMKYMRLKTVKYGLVFVLSHPPPMTLEDETSTEEPLRDREQYVQVIFPSRVPTYLKRDEVLDMYGDVPREGFLHVEGAIDMRASVHLVVTMIQCFARQCFAKNAKKHLMAIHEAISKFQRIFRRRNMILHKSAFRIQSMLHYMRANRKINHMRLERLSALKLQCAFRMWRAKMAELDLRTIHGVRVLKSSKSAPLHPPSTVLDCRSYTMWVVESTEKAEIRVELPKKEAIDGVWIMNSTYEASPKFVSIGVVMDKTSREYVVLHSRVPLALKKGRHWVKFPFKSKISKYFKLTFEGNYGDENHISIRQIRFVRAKEQSATILEQPKHIVMPIGPKIGDKIVVELKVESEGWPLPNFQWYRNGKIMAGETSNVLKVDLFCPLSDSTRSYRCSRCKNMCRTVPKNGYEIICANCGYKFDYKEITKYHQELATLHAEEKKRLMELAKHKETMLQMRGSTDQALLAMLPGIEEQVEVAENVLKELRLARYELKTSMQYVNMYHGEGIYVCAVMNKRGKTVPIRRNSDRTIIVVENPERYPLKTLPFYNPRKPARRRVWTIYSSIKGSFIAGRLDGIVTIRYAGGSYYEGPYVPEEAIDLMGNVFVPARSSTHWGVYTCADGRVFEGYNVDNHFDPENVQGNFRLTMPFTKETYEGMFVDEKFHGVGIYNYSDGSVYEGEWHIGRRYGHGLLRSSEGWVYEGNFDDDKRHGDGIMWWPSGATYIGHFGHNMQEGPGLYISKMRDVYKGNFFENNFEGKGELLYNNGSKYTGEFKKGNRHGTGLYVDRFGTEHFGKFVDDVIHGDHVVKKLVDVPDVNEVCYEVSLCQYNMGQFVQWIGQCINPASTKQFIDMFEKDRKAFDGVYAMLLTRFMPDAPRGIDTSNPDVQRILLKLRSEGGVLTGSESLQEARATLEEVMPLIREKREQIDMLKKEIDRFTKISRTLEAEKIGLMRSFRREMEVVEEEAQKEEQFWIDDKFERRERFKAAVDMLGKVHMDDWFKLKNHRTPPPFLKKIMDAICYLLDLPTDWKSQQMLLSDWIFNSANGDSDALRFTYDCKLVLKLGTYNVFDHADPAEEKDYHLPRILADPRFRRDSYYVESLGDGAPFLVDFVKTNYPYMMAARSILAQRKANEHRRMMAYRVRTTHQKKHIEQNSVGVKLDLYKKRLRGRTEELFVLQKKMSEAHDVLKFVNDSYELGKKAPRDMDYYEQLEKQIEVARDRLAVEASMERLLLGVDEVLAKEKLNMKLTLIAQGVNVPESDDEETEKPKIIDWIVEEVTLMQNQYLEQGIGLGYSLDPDENELSIEQLKGVIAECVENVVLRLNDIYHEQLGVTTWVMMNGKKVTVKFIYVLCWKRWKDEANRMEHEKACEQWESIFGEPASCAAMAIQSKVNWRMSALARKQAAIWANLHPAEMKEAEYVLSAQFAEAHREDDTAAVALEYCDDESGEVDFSAKADALCWARRHPDKMAIAQDTKDSGKADLFTQQFRDETALNCFRILNSMCAPADLEWEEYARHWRNFNSEDYARTENNQTSQMADAFKLENVFGTNVAAAKVTLDQEISQLMEDEEEAAELYPGTENFYNAKCWGMRNQGLFRSGLAVVKAENLARCNRNWRELKDLTVDFTKGSYFHLEQDARDDPSLDRFAGFRDRLEKRFAWVLGYLYSRQLQRTKDLEALQTRDPSERVHHNIRPSELKQYEKSLEDEWLKEKFEAEEELSQVMKKISVWKTYFGNREVTTEQGW